MGVRTGYLVKLQNRKNIPSKIARIYRGLSLDQLLLICRTSQHCPPLRYTRFPRVIFLVRVCVRTMTSTSPASLNVSGENCPSNGLSLPERDNRSTALHYLTFCRPRYYGDIAKQLQALSIQPANNKVLARFGTNVFSGTRRRFSFSLLFSGSRASYQTNYSSSESPEPDQKRDSFRFEGEQVLRLL